MPKNSSSSTAKPSVGIDKAIGLGKVLRSSKYQAEARANQGNTLETLEVKKAEVQHARKFCAGCFH
jgi:hypothetical protein